MGCIRWDFSLNPILHQTVVWVEPAMNNKITRFVGCALLLLSSINLNAQISNDLKGIWNASLKSPGGPLRFQVMIEIEDDTTSAFLINGPEKIKVPEVVVEKNQLMLGFPHYDSKITLTLGDTCNAMSGHWQKTRGKDNAPRMEATFHRNEKRKLDPVAPYLGKWAVDFSSSDSPSVATIHSLEESDTHCWATFQTTTGDYRYLSGVVESGQLELSVFDGAHAFLFVAKRNEEGQLEGDFWSSLNWHETWTAEKNEAAEMPDAFAETTWNAEIPLADFKFPNLNGEPTSLNHPDFTGRPRLIHVFGSWCPNCHDAGIYLGELQKKYGDELSVLGLAFELTGDFERDAEQVRIFHKRHKTDYPTLIAGLADKKLATESIPFLDRVRSYPTTIFLDAKGEVVAIHTGFNGPATGEAYEKLKKEFESRIDEMIENWKSN